MTSTADRSTHIPTADSILRIFTYAIAFIGLALISARLALYIIINYPSPIGDSIFFAASSLNYCYNDLLGTSLASVDASGQSRYIWHGYFQPFVINLLNFSCNNAGQYYALSFISLITAVTVYITGRYARIPLAWIVSLAVVCFALQTKQQFRPETLAILLCVVAEFAFSQRKWPLLTASLSLLAWTHPLGLIVYAAFIAWRMNGELFRSVLGAIVPCLVAFIVVNAALWYLYPYPVRDLLNGLSAQGEFLSRRGDGELFSYFIRSDFFPLFGVFLAVCTALAIAVDYRNILIIPILWWAALRVPPTHYNVMPLLCGMLFYIAWSFRDSGARSRPRVLAGSVFAFALLISTVGLTQGVARDVNAYLRFEGTEQAARARVTQLEAEGLRICGVPIYFAVVFPERPMLKWKAAWRECDAPGAQDVDLTGYATPEEMLQCKPWPTDNPGLPLITRIFRRDSGYSFAVCPAGEVRSIQPY